MTCSAAGYVDMGILNSTYLHEFYKNGFNSHAQNNVVKTKYPDRFLLCGSFDPREEEAGASAMGVFDNGAPYSSRRRGHGKIRYAKRRKRIDHCVHDRCRRADRARLATALGVQRVVRAQRGVGCQS